MLLYTKRCSSATKFGPPRRTESEFILRLLLAAHGDTMLVKQRADLGHRVDDGGNALVMVDGGDEVGGVLGNIDIIVPLALQQFRLAVGQVRAQHSLDDAVIVGLVELVKAGGEEREGAAGKDVAGTAHLQLIADVEHRLAGSDDVVSDKDILALNALAQILMRHDGVAAVDHTAVVAALVEHAEVAAQHAGVVHVAVHGALIGRDDHEVILVEGDIRHMMQQALEHLIGGHDIVEAHGGHGVHDAGVMGIKGDDVLDADRAQLLQGEGAVQTLAADAAMLAAAVQAGHDHADAVGTAGDSLNDAHQVLEVVVRGEVVLIPEELVGNAVVARIDEDVQVVTAGGRLDKAFRIAGLETRAVAGDDEGIDLIIADLTRPAHKVTVYEFAKFLCTGAGNQTEIGDRILLGKEITRAKILFSHYRYSLLPSGITYFIRAVWQTTRTHLLIL